MARFWRGSSEIVAALTFVASLFVTPAAAQDLYDRPVLAVDPGTHTAAIWSLAVDRDGRFAVTGGADRTVRIWSAADGTLLRTIWIPIGPDPVGDIRAVAISPDGTIIAAGGHTEWVRGNHPIYLFDRDSGALIQRIDINVPAPVGFLTFSSDGRYLAALLEGENAGLRVFDRDKNWAEVFRDAYDGDSFGASFARDGRLATTSFGSEGRIRLYDSNFRLVGNPANAPSGDFPFGIAFSPDGRRLAVGYTDAAAVDLLDAQTLERLAGPRSPKNVDLGPAGLGLVTWSRDGQTLFAAGTPLDKGQVVLLAWDQAGLGLERRLTYCQSETSSGLETLPDGRLLVSTVLPCHGMLTAEGKSIWSVPSPLADFRGQYDKIKVSEDGEVIDFGFGEVPGTVKPLKLSKEGEVLDFNDALGTQLRFDVRSLLLSRRVSTDTLTTPPKQDGLPITDWRNEESLMLAGKPIQFAGSVIRSLAIAADGKHFFLGFNIGLVAFDDAGAVKWGRITRSEIWAINASKDGHILVAAYGDGTIRWHRADDGRELLALQVLPNRTDWVLWTPEGFYEATPGAQDVLKWVVNHGPDSAATTLPVSAIPKLHRPDALRLVLNELETARALGIADVSEARLSVQSATGSAKPPGAVLHVLAIGINHFGDKAGTLHLDYAVDDARDVAKVLLDSQKSAPGKAGLYADVSLQLLPDNKADRTKILAAMDTISNNMGKSGSDQDVAVILLSTHGEMIAGHFYLVPYGFDAGTPAGMKSSAVSAEEFAEEVQVIAQRGKVLLLLDACHSGAVGPGDTAANLDASVLRNAVNMDNVTVLTSSKKDELSQELPTWKHGAFTQAFLDALSGRADPEGHGVISMPELAKAMDKDLDALTKGQQHLGPHVNFLDDIFVVSH